MYNAKELERLNKIIELLDVSDNEIYLVIKKYFISYPEKYYNEQACDDYYRFLQKSFLKNESAFLRFISEREESFNISYKLLSNINNKAIHEVDVKITDAGFIDDNINYNYLQLFEGVLLLHMQLVAWVQFLEEGKGTDNLDLYTCVNKLISNGFAYIGDVYEHNVRNGIGHGKIMYYESKAEYIDKKGNKSTVYYDQFIKKFDKLLDIANGFALAYLIFWLKTLKPLGIAMPRQLLFEEVKLKNTSSEITITGILGQDILDKRTLVVRLLSICLSKVSLINRIQEIAINVAQLIGLDYDVIQLDVTHNNWSGYIKFDLKMINEILSSNLKNKDYSHAIVDRLEFYLVGFKEDMPASMDLNCFSEVIPNKIIERKVENVGPFVFKDISQHASSYNQFLLVKDSRYVYTGPEIDNKSMMILIKSYLPKILEHTRAKSKELLIKSYHKDMPLDYICVAIYEDDKRIRELRRNGLRPNMICTVQHNTSKVTKNIKLMDSAIELIGNSLFNWNHYWRNSEEYDKMFPG